MPDAPSYPSRLHFTRDLRQIRERRSLTLEALHEETKIPLSVLEEFEETGLFDNPMFNRVYLRSLVRTYATFVGIPTKAMLEALDEALLDTYKGSLARHYLKDSLTEAEPVHDAEAPPVIALAPEEPAPEEPAPEEPASEEPAPPEEETTVAEVPPEPEEAVANETPPEPEETAVSEETTGPADRAVVQEIEHLLRAGKRAPTGTVEAPAPSEEAPAPDTPAEGTGRARTRPPLLSTAEASPEARAAGRRTKPLDVKRRAWYTQWFAIVGIFVGFAAAIWAVLFLLQRPGDPDTPQTAAANTAAVDSVAAEPELPPPKITLGDTLYVVVLAVEKVERIQIRRDDDLLRSYWIEAGVAKAFPALERIVFENRLDLIRLLVDGYEYPTGIRDEEGRVVITREGLQAFADSLTASPVILPATPDTIQLWPVRGQ